jgi:hypothetical protein
MNQLIQKMINNKKNKKNILSEIFKCKTKMIEDYKVIKNINKFGIILKIKSISILIKST